MKIQISQIKINLKDIREKVNEEKQLLINKVSALLKLNKDNITDLIILRRSFDFRYKPELFYVYSVEVSLVNTDAEKLIRKLKNNNISVSQRKEYKFPYTNSRAYRGYYKGKRKGKTYCYRNGTGRPFLRIYACNERFCPHFA